MIELNISGAEVSVDKVVTVLAELSVEACVSQTSNVCRAEEGFRIEPGAHITMPNCTRDAFVQAVWPALKETFALRCGWMDASMKSFRGCTENYIRESSCPVIMTEASP